MSTRVNRYSGCNTSISMPYTVNTHKVCSLSTNNANSLQFLCCVHTSQNQQIIFYCYSDFIINRKSRTFKPFPTEADKRNVNSVRVRQIGNREFTIIWRWWRAIRFSLKLFYPTSIRLALGLIDLIHNITILGVNKNPATGVLTLVIAFRGLSPRRTIAG